MSICPSEGDREAVWASATVRGSFVAGVKGGQSDQELRKAGERKLTSAWFVGHYCISRVSGKGVIRTRERLGLHSGDNVRFTVGTPCLELLQSLDSSRVPNGRGRGGSHEEHAGQQGQDKEEPLGIHGERGGIEVEDGNLGVPSSWGPPFIIEKYCIIPRSVAWSIGVSLLMHQSSVTSIQVSEAPSLPENRTVR